MTNEASSAPTAPTTPGKRPKGRSPGFPAIDLATALIRAKSLWERERQHPTPVRTAVQHWGYSSVTGRAGLTLSALKKFGLVTDEGSNEERKVRVSDLAVRAFSHPSEGERQAAVARAAMSPSMHRELWTKYGPDLPSDESLRWYLVQERDFTESGARELLREYKSTLKFADIQGSAWDSRDRNGDLDANADVGLDVDIDDEREVSPSHDLSRELARESVPATTSAAPQSGTSDRAAVTLEELVPTAREVHVPLPGGLSLSLSGPFPLRTAEWDYVLRVLDVMKPGLTQDVTAAD